MVRLASQQLGARVKLSGSRKLDPGSDLSPAPQWSTGTSTGWSCWGRPQTTCPTCRHRSARATRPRTTGSGTWNPTAHPLVSDPNPTTRLQSDKDCPSVGTLLLPLDVCPCLGIGALVSQGKRVTSQRSRAGVPAALSVPGPADSWGPSSLRAALFTVSSALETPAVPGVRGAGAELGAAPGPQDLHILPLCDLGHPKSSIRVRLGHPQTHEDPQTPGYQRAQLGVPPQQR